MAGVLHAASSCLGSKVGILPSGYPTFPGICLTPVKRTVGKNAVKERQSRSRYRVARENPKPT